MTEDTRMACAALGWKVSDGSIVIADHPGQPVVWEADDCIHVECSVQRDVRGWAVDRPTLLLAAVLRDAPAVDVGPCSACAERLAIRRAMIGEVRDLMPPDRAPCACVIAASEAVLVASRPTDLSTATGQRLDEIAPLARVRRRPGETDATLRAWLSSLPLPGLNGARDALARLAADLREHLPVLADEWQARGGLTDFCKAAHAGWAGALAGDRDDLSIAAWLADSAYGHSSFKTIDERDDLDLGALAQCTSVPRILVDCPALPTWIDAWLAGDIGVHLPAIRRRVYAMAEEWAP